ncbi:ribonuclease H-like domain-containing protein [Tanacetum coccineum]
MFDETVFPYGTTPIASVPTYNFLDDLPDVIPQTILQSVTSPTPNTPTTTTTNISLLPKSYCDAFNDPHWKNVMRDEYTALIKNKTWTLVPRPPDTNIVCCMWLFHHKYLENGTLSRYKARLVANGSTQLEGVDVDETFSPVIKPGTIQTVLSLAASRHWPIHQLDVRNSFLHGDLSKTVYMNQPPGFRDFVHPDYVCLLQRSLHGIDIAYLLLYVDDIKKYALEILDMAHMANCNPSQNPIDIESKLGSDGDLVYDLTLYISLAGSLQYLTFTRPDISYAVQQVCLYMHDPREPHFSALKRILLYVWGTLDYGLQRFSSSTTYLVAYLNVDRAGGCPTTRRSTSSYCVFLGNNLLSCSSKLQLMLSHSSVEAECRGVANAVAETCWLRNLLHELHSSFTVIICYWSGSGSSCSITLLVYGYLHQGLPSALFEEFRSSLSVWCPPALTAGEC